MTEKHVLNPRIATAAVMVAKTSNRIAVRSTTIVSASWRFSTPFSPSRDRLLLTGVSVFTDAAVLFRAPVILSNSAPMDVTAAALSTSEEEEESVARVASAKPFSVTRTDAEELVVGRGHTDGSSVGLYRYKKVSEKDNS